MNVMPRLMLLLQVLLTIDGCTFCRFLLKPRSCSIIVLVGTQACPRDTYRHTSSSSRFALFRFCAVCTEVGVYELYYIFIWRCLHWLGGNGAVRAVPFVGHTGWWRRKIRSCPWAGNELHTRTPPASLVRGDLTTGRNELLHSYQ